MADSKLTGLTDAGSVLGTDLTYVVTDPGGSPTSHKLTIAELFTSPSLVTPSLGAATYTTLIGGNITDSGLTAGRVTFAGIAGLLSDDSDMTFATDTLTVTKIIASSSITAPGAGTTSEKFGLSSAADGNNSTALGNTASSSGTNSVAVGDNSSAGLRSVIVGSGATSNGDAAGVAVGYNAAIGNGGKTSGIAIGNQATSSGDDCIAIGTSATAGTNSQSIAIGSGAQALLANQFVAGSSTKPINNVYFGKGYQNATPTSYTINGTGGTGSNISGGDLLLGGGIGTGTGVGGKVTFRNALHGTTGSSANTLADSGWFDESGNFNVQNLTASLLVATDASKNLVSLGTGTYPSLTEISYVKGVTSAIQTQLNGKQASGSYLTSVTADSPLSGSGTSGSHLVLSTSGTWSGTATTATNAVNVGITDDTSTNATMYPTWVTDTSGNLPQKISSTKLTFNPSTGVLASTTFSGAGTSLTGTAASLTAGAVTVPAALGSSTATTQSSSDNSTKLATTAYVTTAVTNALNGLDWKPAVGYATTANVVGTNTAGVFTYTSTGVDTIDGHTLALNDVVLFKNQTTGADNGVWVVTTAGAVGVAGVLTRRSDYNVSADIHQGDTFYVINGTANSNTSWVQTATVTTINTDALAFSQVSGPGTYAAGNGLTLTGNSFSINTGVTVDLSTSQSLTNKNMSGAGNTWPTFNQNTSGSAATLTTARAIYGNNFDGSAALNQVIASTYGGTGNGFTKISGPTTSERTKTMRDASDTVLELGGSYTPTGTWTSLTMVTPVLGTPTSGTLTNCTFPTLNQNTSGSAATLTTARAIWGQNFDGSAAITGSLTGVGNITGGASSMTITAGTGNSRTLALQSTTSGGTATTFLTGNADQTTTFASNISGTGSWTLTGGAGNMTIVSGTGNSRTMILQTTTSGGTATTFLTGNADQSATFAGAVSLGTSNALTCGTIELGAASDTTIARVSAGKISVEGVNVVTTSSTDTLTNKSMSEAQVTFTDITTGNASTSNHGFIKKLSNTATQYMDGSGNWSVPSGGGLFGVVATDFSTTSLALVDVTGLQVTVPANQTWGFRVAGSAIVSSGTAGAKFAITGAHISALNAVWVTGASAFNYDHTTTSTGLTGAVVTGNNINTYLSCDFTVTMDGTGGTVSVQVLKVTSQTITVQALTYLIGWRLA